MEEPDQTGGSATPTPRVPPRISEITDPESNVGGSGLKVRRATAAAAYAVCGPISRVAARSAKVPRAAHRWRLLQRPHFDNNLATLEVGEEGYTLVWESGVVAAGDHEHPELHEVGRIRITARPKV